MANKTTKTLSQNALARAAQYLKAHARPLETARFLHLFGGGSVDTIITELAGFQNDDGGFGHGLEADLRTPDSSALCTSIAFQIILHHGIAKEEALVQKALTYLIHTFDDTILHWRIIPESASESHHAPWWTQDDRDSFALNPTAELLGYLLDYADTTDVKHVISPLTERVLKVMDSIQPDDMHNILCCLRLMDSNNLPSETKRQIENKLTPIINNAVETDPEKWKEYSMRPLQVIHSPSSPFLNGMERAVAQNLDYEIDEQQADGSWPLTWSWYEDYPEAWEQAKHECSGYLTLEKLITLQRFGRIDIVPHT